MTEEKQSVRAFVSVHLPAGVRERLRTAQEELEHAIPKSTIRWTPFEQLHLTLEFLGNVATGDLARLESALKLVAMVHRSFGLSAEHVGAFSSIRNPRVIWAGIEGEIEAVKALQAAVKNSVQSFVVEQETRAYKPHVTLGRVRPVKGRDLRQVSEALAAATERDFGSWRVDEFALMQSKLSPHGSQHSTLATFPLGG
jgi:RNA 2',3'-cyclic 3'-phosphodiesterase